MTPDTTQKRRQKKRREALNLEAQAVGFQSWSELGTAVINKLYYLPLSSTRPVPTTLAQGEGMSTIKANIEIQLPRLERDGSIMLDCGGLGIYFPKEVITAVLGEPFEEGKDTFPGDYWAVRDGNKCFLLFDDTYWDNDDDFGMHLKELMNAVNVAFKYSSPKVDCSTQT